MQTLFKLETLKIIAGASIVLTAACIMLSSILGYVFSLARLGLVILIAIVVSSALAFLVQFLLKGKKLEIAGKEKDETTSTEIT